MDPALVTRSCVGIAFGIAAGGRALIGDEMGLGKTLQVPHVAVVMQGAAA